VVNITSSSELDLLLSARKSILVQFQAPWCSDRGHCQVLNGPWELTAEVFAGSEVVLARVDAEAYPAIASRFEVKGLPTLRYFHQGDPSGEEYLSGRIAENIVEFLNRRHGMQRALPQPVKTVMQLTEKTFQEALEEEGGKHMMVLFYAPWCAHSKALLPIYSLIAAAYQREGERIIIGQIDAAKYTSVTKSQGISGYPTIKWFSPLGGSALVYDGERTPMALMSYVNLNAGLDRHINGKLGPGTGRVTELDAVIAGYVDHDASKRAEMKSDIDNALATLTEEDSGWSESRYYVDVIKKIDTRGLSFVDDELTRLKTLIAAGKCSMELSDSLSKKRNVLTSFTQFRATELDLQRKQQLTEAQAAADAVAVRGAL